MEAFKAGGRYVQYGFSAAQDDLSSHTCQSPANRADISTHCQPLYWIKSDIGMMLLQLNVLVLP